MFKIVERKEKNCESQARKMHMDGNAIFDRPLK